MADKEGNKTGGRAKGTPNKKTQELYEIAERMDCNPFKVLLMFAKGDFEGLGFQEIEERKDKEGKIICNLTISPELRQKSAKDACEYLFPKLKSIEHSGEIAGNSTLERLIGKISGTNT